MEVNETIWVGMSIQSYSCVSLAMYPVICRCYRRYVLPGICARKRKAILATNTTRLPTVLYFPCSVSDQHLVARYWYPTRYLAICEYEVRSCRQGKYIDWFSGRMTAKAADGPAGTTTQLNTGTLENFAEKGVGFAAPPYIKYIGRSGPPLAAHTLVTNMFNILSNMIYIIVSLSHG